MPDRIRPLLNNHKGTWGLVAALIGVLTALSLLGILPWATKAEVKDLKVDISGRFDRIEDQNEKIRDRVDKIYRALIGAYYP